MAKKRNPLAAKGIFIKSVECLPIQEIQCSGLSELPGKFGAAVISRSLAIFFIFQLSASAEVPANTTHAGIDPANPIPLESYYPDASKRAGEQGRCVLKFHVSKEGNVTNVVVTVSSGFPRLDEASILALQSAHLLPATLNGKPIDSDPSMPIVWKLTQPIALVAKASDSGSGTSPDQNLGNTLSPSTHAESIPLKRDGGTFVVPVLINGRISLDFTVDSGAADVSIPADVFSTLIRAGTVTKADLIGKQVYEMADGSRRTSQRFRIRSLRVGTLELRDVTGSVAPPVGSLLLGQSFLSRFKSWSIDNRRQALVIDDSSPSD